MGSDKQTYNVYRQLGGKLVYVGSVEADGAHRAIEAAKREYGIASPIVEEHRG